MRVADCTEGLIVGNSITQRKYYAIYLTGSLEGNRIYGNNFNGKKDNDTLQAYVSATSANPTWDNGTIGNYWNTYLNVYPNASEIGTSGIGDTPFVIKPDGIDHFPLMTPIDPFTISVPETVSSLLPSLPQNGQNREGDNTELPPASYLVLAVVSVVIIAVAVTTVVLTRNHRMQRTTAPNPLTSTQFPVFSAIKYAYQKRYCHQRQSKY